MNVKLYNTLTKSKETVEQTGDRLEMFVCGPTVYDHSHIGHAKTYIQMDILARTLRRAGYELFYLQNITDIDDKIIIRSNEQSMDWKELKSKFENDYLEDVRALNVTSVDKYARATDHIDDIIRQVQSLLDKGCAYEIEDDGIYFEIDTFPEYGKLSRRSNIMPEDAQSRIDESAKKRGWNDFCLWKFSKPDEPSWNAPFGAGRPGWHIEDTAITEHYFGQQYDIHGGAVDLIFPHHEAEITQMESISGKSPFVRIWVHSGFLNISNEKMAKSLGNFYTIREVLGEGYDPAVLRLLMLQSHYRSNLDFKWDYLDDARNRLLELRSIADLRWQLIDKYNNPPEPIDFSKYTDKFMDIMADDINTPQALSEISSHFNTISAGLVAKSQEREFLDYLKAIDEVFGLQLLESSDITEEQKQLIHERDKARENGDYDHSDSLREELKQQSLEVRDTPYGSIWARTSL